MGKRSDKPRVERDFYPTPEHAVLPLLDHLPEDATFDEPCAGNGALIDHLEKHGRNCRLAIDIVPQRDDIGWGNAFDISGCLGDCFITNPPYKWEILDKLIPHLYRMAPTFLLLPADMMHNIRVAPHMEHCLKVISVGRVKWFGNVTGMENSAWYLFHADNDIATIFYGRSI
tara:strand:- start:5 stop:520 length:516 start_codon:yes stop_codon:yes gene_type:complete